MTTPTPVAATAPQPISKMSEEELVTRIKDQLKEMEETAN